jgi:hypothetical protein
LEFWNLGIPVHVSFCAMWSRHWAGRQISNPRRVYGNGEGGDVSRMLERVVIGLAHAINELEREWH